MINTQLWITPAWIDYDFGRLIHFRLHNLLLGFCFSRNPVNNIFGNIMIPCDTYEGIIEGHSADNDVAHEIIEYRNISAFNGPKCGITSNTAVHKLLECPVCVNVMFPPDSPVSKWPYFMLQVPIESAVLPNFLS